MGEALSNTNSRNGFARKVLEERSHFCTRRWSRLNMTSLASWIILLHPIINKFLEVFRHIKDARKIHMCPHLISFSERHLFNLAVIVCMHPWLASVLEGNIPYLCRILFFRQILNPRKLFILGMREHVAKNPYQAGTKYNKLWARLMIQTRLH